MIKTLASQIKEFKKDTILTPLFMFLEVAMEMIIPLMMASIIDDGVNAGDMKHILIVGAWMILAAGIGLFAGVMGGKYGASASAGFARNLRETLFKKIQSYSFANIDKFSTASLITRLTTDITNLQNAFQMSIRMGMRAPASLIAALAMSVYISPRLATIYLVAVVILTVVILVLAPIAKKLFDQLFKKYDNLNAKVQENVSAARVVKAYVREDFEKEKFHSANDAVYQISLKVEKLLVMVMPLMMACVYGCILMISWKGAHFIVAGSLTTGEMMSMLAYCMNILMSLMMLAMVFVMIMMSSASAKRTTEIINEEPSITNPEDPIMEVPDGSISFSNVDFSYQKDAKELVLKQINFQIQSGETIGIIGSTGSAKTSLVNLISRLYDVNSGKVCVGGIDVCDYDLEVLRDAVAVVLQKNVLFSGTIYDNLRWGNKEATEEECRRVCQLACADEFIDRMSDGYDTYIEQGGSNVSGGQRQRLCIARALLKKPKILILDDSTSAVDTSTDAKIRRAFREEIPETTKLIIAQRISSVADAQRIIVLNEGEINGFGTHEELLETNEIYRDIYESQTGTGMGDFDEGKEEE